MLVLLGCNHTSAPVSLRERLAVPGEQVGELVRAPALDELRGRLAQEELGESDRELGIRRVDLSLELAAHGIDDGGLVPAALHGRSQGVSHGEVTVRSATNPGVPRTRWTRPYKCRALPGFAVGDARQMLAELPVRYPEPPHPANPGEGPHLRGFFGIATMTGRCLLGPS